MKAISENNILNELLDHFYDSNPDYKAKIRFIYFSEDRKLLSAYWELPEGWFDYEFKYFNEVGYIIEGELDLVKKNEEQTVRGGDFYIMNIGEIIRFRVKKNTKIHVLNYPIPEEIYNDIKKMIQNGVIN